MFAPAFADEVFSHIMQGLGAH
eukprot:SAG31_NODE_12606_length_930_cov_1.036101_1_plen_21_part_01